MATLKIHCGINYDTPVTAEFTFEIPSDGGKTYPIKIGKNAIFIPSPEHSDLVDGVNGWDLTKHGYKNGVSSYYASGEHWTDPTARLEKEASETPDEWDSIEVAGHAKEEYLGQQTILNVWIVAQNVNAHFLSMDLKRGLRFIQATSDYLVEDDNYNPLSLGDNGVIFSEKEKSKLLSIFEKSDFSDYDGIVKTYKGGFKSVYLFKYIESFYGGIKRIFLSSVSGAAHTNYSELEASNMILSLHNWENNGNYIELSRGELSFGKKSGSRAYENGGSAFLNTIIRKYNSSTSSLEYFLDDWFNENDSSKDETLNIKYSSQRKDTDEGFCYSDNAFLNKTIITILDKNGNPGISLLPNFGGSESGFSYNGTCQKIIAIKPASSPLETPTITLKTII